MTAQEMNRENTNLYSRFNITWNFPVGSGGAQYLVRLHFCVIVSCAQLAVIQCISQWVPCL